MLRKRDENRSSCSGAVSARFCAADARSAALHQLALIQPVDHHPLP